MSDILSRDMNLDFNVVIESFESPGRYFATKFDMEVLEKLIF